MNTGTDFKSGFVALLGRPNVGKSSFINASLSSEILPTSNVSQTTRKIVRAIITDETSQLILVDTPGVHKPHDTFDADLNKLSIKQGRDADVIAFCLDSSQDYGKGDAYLLDQIKEVGVPKVLLITKCDKTTDNVQNEQVERAQCDLLFDAVCKVSSKTGAGIKEALEQFRSYLPAGPLWFPSDTTADADDAILIAGLIEESIFKNVRDEIPYDVGVKIDDIEYRSEELLVVSATVMVTSLSQKRIIIGSGGSLIKKIGMQARRRIEGQLACKLYLDLHVKIVPNWRKAQS